MTKPIPENMRVKIDIPESDWATIAGGIVWSYERRHVAKFFTSSTRCKNSGAFKFELSRGGFKSAVFVFALNFWSQLALIPMQIFLMFIVLGTTNGRYSSLRRTDIEIWWSAGIIMFFFVAVSVQRLTYWRRVYGKKFSGEAQSHASR